MMSCTIVWSLKWDTERPPFNASSSLSAAHIIFVRQPKNATLQAHNLASSHCVPMVFEIWTLVLSYNIEFAKNGKLVFICGTKVKWIAYDLCVIPDVHNFPVIPASDSNVRASGHHSENLPKKKTSLTQLCALHMQCVSTNLKSYNLRVCPFSTNLKSYNLRVCPFSTVCTVNPEYFVSILFSYISYTKYGLVDPKR